MKNVNDLIEKAIELRNRGLRSGEIADELNISRETATWLLTRAKKETGAQAPKDIFIDWSNIGKSSSRLMLIATCMADMVEEVLNEMDSNVDVVVQSPWSDAQTGTTMTDTLILIIKEKPAEGKAP